MTGSQGLDCSPTRRVSWVLRILRTGVDLPQGASNRPGQSFARVETGNEKLTSRGMNLVDSSGWRRDHQSDDLPRTERLVFHDPGKGGIAMEFRLTYRGPLPSQQGSGKNTRSTEKHQLRKEFHKQLRELWKQHPDMRRQAELRYRVVPTPAHMMHAGSSGRQFYYVEPYDHTPDAKTWIEVVADDFQRLGGRFVPLVRKTSGFTCSLDILFLRRDNPGHLIASGGDIDNRIKVLFDGLRMPDSVLELGGFALDPDENPFYTVLEEDSLITSVSVTTDRLVSPMESGDRIHDVHLVIHVTVQLPSIAGLFGLV